VPAPEGGGFVGWLLIAPCLQRLKAKEASISAFYFVKTEAIGVLFLGLVSGLCG